MDKYIKPGLKSLYTSSQVQAYLRRIRFPGGTSSFHPDLTNLEQLIKLHLLAFPFENTRLHYSYDHEVNVSPDYVYNRLVERRQGGSWCCGHNGLFLGMIRGLGYRAYAVSARANESPHSEPAREFTFLVHLVLLVQFDGEFLETHLESDSLDPETEHCRQRTYLVDVGFGGTGAVRPMLLEVGRIAPGSAPPEEHRIMRAMHPDSSLADSESTRQWVLEYRCGLYQPNWSVLYMFDEVEALPSDWIAFSQWLCAHPVQRFMHNVVSVRYFLVEDDGQDTSAGLLGRLVMTGKRVQRRIGATSQTIREYSTESERVRILKEDFGIIVEEDEVKNIVAPAALPLT